MAERTSGLHRVVTVPSFYAWIQGFLGGPEAKTRVAAELFAGLDGARVVEIGCGPGLWTRHLGHVASYVGIDRNAQHIEQAREGQSSASVQFIHGDLADPLVVQAIGTCDAIIGIGILHHLDDPVARSVLARCADLLPPGGRYIGLEPVLHPRQHPVARLLKWLDSGQNIRTEPGYQALFPDAITVRTRIVRDFMRVPYSHCVIRGEKP